jgi:RecB family endonuclease NucS
MAVNANVMLALQVPLICCWHPSQPTLQAAASDREAAVAAVREEAAAQLRAAQEAAAAAQALLAEAQSAAAAESERMAAEKSELDKQLKVAQVRIGCSLIEEWL